MQDQDRVSRIGDLIAYLHAHPQERGSPDAIAAELGFESAFVARVISGLDKLPAVRQPKAKSRNWAKESRVWLRASVDRWPLIYIFLSVVLFVAALDFMPHLSTTQSLLFALGLFVVLAVFQGTIYFKRATPMLPVKASLIGFVPVMGLVVFSIVEDKSEQSIPRSSTIGLMIVAVIMLSAIYASLFAALSAWGSFYKSSRKNRLASRHDLLQRYFEVSDRLKDAQTIPVRETFGMKLVRVYRRHAYYWAFGWGVLMSSLVYTVGRLYSQNPYEAQVDVNGHTHMPGAYLFWMFIVGILGLFMFALMSYYAGGIKKSALVYVCSSIPTVSANILTSGVHTMLLAKVESTGQRSTVVHASSLVNIAISFCVNLSFAVLIGGASLLAENNKREKLILENDESTLVSELFNLQMRLSEQPTRVCVVVVDAAKSTAMKANADPLIAEFSFRRYQEWISKVVAKFGGRVEATAGDGAIIAFADAKQGAHAALELQEDLDRFNSQENKLPVPFQLRIGIHSGDVVADLAEVQFTRVIDIAAHIEKVSPIGGVAMTDAAAVDLTGFTLTPMPDHVDGCQVFVLTAEEA